jgi:rhamnosyltransferase
VAIITSKYKDRSVEVDFGMTEDHEKVSFCITSGAFNNVKCIKAVGGFDEKLFIDMVDYDICYALTRNGYKIIRLNYTGFLHEVGRSTTKKFFGKNIIIFNHSPLRKYYWVRNSIYLKRKYKLGFRSDVRVVKRMIQTLLYEEDKFRKLKSMFKGVADGYRM